MCIRLYLEKIVHTKLNLMSQLHLVIAKIGLTKQRIKMYLREGGEGEFAPFKLNEPCDSFVLGEVVESSVANLKKGDHVVTVGPWQKFSVVDAAGARKISKDVRKLSIPIRSTIIIWAIAGAMAKDGRNDV